MTSAKRALGPVDLKALRAALEAKRAELLREHRENLSAGTHAQQPEPDPVDAATHTAEEDELLSLVDQERGLLAQIDRALAKMERGTYGVSELSGDRIPLARLRAIPWARFTAEEEEEAEEGE